ncbi:MAG: hypothetical protein V4584_07035 [Verrucomicrobiota bacterium]
MKSITRTIGLVTLGFLLPLQAQSTSTTKTTETTQSADGTTTETTTTTTTFNPEARTKVITYFNTYKGERYGLPPGYVSKVQVKEIPAAWRTTRISPGMVVNETQRSYLVDAPPELIKVLPAASGGVRYYIAGSNVVAVDPSYKIVDSVQIPSIKYTENEDEVTIESKEPGKTTTTEIDKDDGEVETETEEDD